MIPLGIDPSVKKHALAWRQGKNMYCAYYSLTALPDILELVRTVDGVTDVFYEGPYLGLNPLSYRVLIELMDDTRRIVQAAGLEWHEVHPMTWKVTCLTVNGHFAKTRDEQKRLSIMRASDIVKHAVEDDNLADAICIADWAEKMKAPAA